MNLSDFLTRFEAPEEDRDGFRVHCPAHTDTQASLRVAVSTKGNVLVKCRAGCETRDVMKSLGLGMRDLAGMEPDVVIRPARSTDAPASPADVARLAVDLDHWREAMQNEPLGGPAAEYAQHRFGVTLADCGRLGLGYTDDLPGGPRLVVPFRDKDGVARGYQARALTPDAPVRWLGPKSPDGASWAKVAYFPGDSGWDEVFITEGPGDGLTAVGIGYDTILIRGAGLVTNDAVIAEVAEMLGDRLAVIAGDGDPAGRTFSARLAQALVAREKRVKVLQVPDGLDLTDWRAETGVRFASTIIREVQATEEVTNLQAVLRDRDDTRYPLSDLGNAGFVRDFIEGKGSGVKFAPEAGFFLLRSGVWRTDRLDRTRAYVQEAAVATATIAHRLMSDAEPGTDAEKVAKAWKRWATYSQSSNGISAALRELAALPDVATDVNDFDQHPDLLAVANGVVDLRTGELGPHDPSLLLTRRLEIDFDPEAKAPRWESFLTEVFPAHPDLPGYMRRLVGYGITGRTDEQAFAVLWGTGANGKSVFTDTLTEIFREFTVTTPFSTFEEKQSGGIPNDLAALKGARLVMAAEGDQGKPMAEAMLKRVTGRDLISARFMRKEFFEFRPTFLLLLATNFKPKFKGQDEGLWRRVKLIPWERYFAPAERDHRLGDRLLRERTGILTWAVRGAMEWYANGLQDPAIVRDSTKEYRETSDTLAGFLPGVYIRDDAAGRIDGALLFKAYLDWTEEENLGPRDRWTRNTFYAALEERGAVKRRTKKGVGFEGIRRVRQHDFADERVTGAGEADYFPDTLPPTRGASVLDGL